MTQQLLRPSPGAWRRVVAVLAVLAVAGMGLFYTNRVESHLQCQARYNETNNARTRALTEATEKERAADRAEDKARADLVTHPAVLKPLTDRTAVDREQLRALTVVWQRTLAEEQVQQAAADAERRDHPVPPPPSELCR